MKNHIKSELIKERINHLLSTHATTKTALAHAIGMDVSQLSKLLNRQGTIPVDYIEPWAECLGIDVNELINSRQTISKDWVRPHAHIHLDIDVDINRVTYHNKTALSLLGLLTFSNLRQLDNIHPSLAEAFRQVSANSEQRATFFTERGERTIILTATEAAIHDKTVKIIAFNDISNEIAENEELAWSRLIRVLTHEIMNTVTPIASLSETLSKDPTSPDLVRGLQTISTSSKDLIKFVNTYRSLTRVATPVRKSFDLRELIERVEQLTKPQIDAAGARYQYTELTDDILLYADEGQISQVIVNLISNALQAEATQITITAKIDDADAVVIDVCNNGHPISPDSQEQIFIPFFTTKPEGSGIGLSLSRQIMRLHNGSIRLVRSDERGTIFTLVFR